MSGNNGTVITVTHDTSPYGYIPSRGIAIIFVFLFLTSTILHGGQAIKYRKWWPLLTAVLCGIIEVAGWSGRLWSSYSPLNSTAFQIQITSTIIAPTPLLAASFVILADIIRQLGPAYSRLTPKWYSILFTSCDVISLFVQGAGGGIASAAADLDGANRGAHIMLFGIVFQLFVIIGYVFCAVEFFIRYNKDVPVSRRSEIRGGKSVRRKLTPNIKLMCYALIFSTICFFIRSIYRIIELSGGWDGRIIHTQVYFNVLDGAMIVLAMYTLNSFHPGRLLKVQEEATKLEYLNV